MTSKISIYYQNCRGLRTKLNTLYNNILADSHDIIILSETWLVPDIDDAEFIDSRYIVYRCDRNRVLSGKSDGGGVLIAVRRGLNATRCELMTTLCQDDCYHTMPHNIDYVLLKFYSKTVNMYHTVCGIYIPPNQTLSTYQSLFYLLEKEMSSITISNIYIFGDFNLPHIEWVAYNSPALMPCIHNNNSPLEILLLNFLSTLNCKQYNNTKNQLNRTLDLLISNDVCACEPAPTPIIPVDVFHPPFMTIISFELNQAPMARCSAPRYRFIEANYTAINNEINEIDWLSVLDNSSLDSATQCFYETIYKIIKSHVPMRPVKCNEYPIWFSRPLIHIFKNKEKAWCKWKKYKNCMDYEQFSLYRRRFKLLSADCFNRYLHAVESNIQKDVKQFWSFIKSHKRNTGIPNTMSYNNEECSGPVDVCKLFSKFFSSVYEPTSNNSSDSITPSDSQVLITDLTFSRDTIVKSLKSLDVTKSCGPDGIPPFFLKYSAESIGVPLLNLFNRSLKEGIVPQAWKVAHITPVFKSGTKNDVTNYRPISLLPTLSKVLERLVHNAIYPILHNIIIPEQHGFVLGRSTVSNLVLYSNILFENMDNQLQVDSIYTDFCKAFDKVDHTMLLQKIEFNGIRGSLLRWFASYVRNRSQRVVVQGFSSDVVSVTSGVPQGSILGPLLFVLFVNDINTCFKNCNFLLYADDLKVFRKISSTDDCVKLQEDLDRFSAYCVANKLQLSLPKCKSISFTKKINVVHFTYSLCQTPLERVSLIKDLGVLFDSKLHFDAHVDHITTKGYQLYGFIKRTCNLFKKPSTFLLLYKSLIRSQLEYATCVWNPLYDKYSDQLESVQRKCLRYVNYIIFRKRSSYHTLLEKFSLSTLKLRRLYLDQSFLYKICRNQIDCTNLINQIYIRIPSRSQRIRNTYAHSLFALKPCRTNAGKRAPLRRIMKSYNDNFSDIDLFVLSLAKFKRCIQEKNIQSSSQQCE